MTDAPPLPPLILETPTPEARAAILALVGGLERQIAESSQRARERKARLDRLPPPSLPTAAHAAGA